MLLMSPAYALEVEGLYQAKVPVVGQGREERLELYPDALAQVIVKLTGKLCPNCRSCLDLWRGRCRWCSNSIMKSS